jgi:hypothetical protein
MAKKPPATKASTFTYGLGNPARTDVIKPSTYKPPQPKNKSSGSSRSSLDKKIDAKFQGVERHILRNNKINRQFKYWRHSI